MSASYPKDDSADQALVDFLATREHGPELGSIQLFVGKPGRGHRASAAAARWSRATPPPSSACTCPARTPRASRPGTRSRTSTGTTSRRRAATTRGTRSTGGRSTGPAPSACAPQCGRRVLWPGDQGRHYFADPGEGFADGYAHLHYPDVPWQYNPLMRPDAASSPRSGATSSTRGRARGRASCIGARSLRLGRSTARWRSGLPRRAARAPSSRCARPTGPSGTSCAGAPRSAWTSAGRPATSGCDVTVDGRAVGEADRALPRVAAAQATRGPADARARRLRLWPSGRS